jgi:hypothetical protein
MEFKDITKGTEPNTTALRLGYEGGTLQVSTVTIIDEVETVTLSMIQPWKCNPDGTRSDFLNAEDAFAWAESVKDSIL